MAAVHNFSLDQGSDKVVYFVLRDKRGVSGFLCLGRLFQGQPNEAALCI